MPTYGSLFSGVGGFDMGFDQAGYECVFQVEWDKHCQQILAKHWPEVPKWSDVQEVNGAEVPPCDVLTFGSPCQDLSVAGKRAGLDGGRSSMFYEATRIIKEMRNATESVYPRVVVWENVPGALSSNNGADFGQVLDTLADIGAVDIHWSILDAQYFGVPQRRRRIFVVAIFDPAAADNCPETLLPVIKGSRGDFKKSRTARKNATGHAAPSVDSSGQWAAGSTDADILSTSVCSKWAKGSGGPSGSEHYNMVVESETIGALCARDFKGVGNQYVDENKLVIQEAFVKSRRAQSDTDDETWVEGDVTPTLNAFDNGGESRATVLMPIPIHDQATRFAGRNGEKIGVGKGNGFGIGEPGDPMHTLTQGDQHAVFQPFVAEPQPPFVFDGTRHDDFRMDTETVPTLKQRMGTGGGQVPMVAEAVAYDEYNDSISEIHHAIRAGTKQSTGVIQPILSFDTQFGSNANVFEDQAPTLKASQQSPSIAYEEVIGFGGKNGLDGPQASTETFPVLRTTPGNHTVAYSIAYDALNGIPSEVHPTLRATHGSNGDFVAHQSEQQLAVRRLTPLECERLMGWPDDHTRWTADGKEQADTNRYKQCGNGVATPVARWIAQHIKALL